MSLHQGVSQTLNLHGMVRCQEKTRTEGTEACACDKRCDIRAAQTGGAGNVCTEELLTGAECHHGGGGVIFKVVKVK